MITVSHQKEGLSIGYVTATAAAARINLSISHQYDYGVDGIFLGMAQRSLGINEHGKEIFRYVESGTKLDFQLKCTTNWMHRDNNVVWSIEGKTYNDIVSRPPHAPLILVLLCLPKDEAHWLSTTEQQMVLKNCCGVPPISPDISARLI